jgi:hypothetical protein
MFTTAAAFVDRLSAIEKITIRAANTEDRLDWLFNVMHRYEFALPADEARQTFNSAVKILHDDFVAASLTTGGF